MRVRLYIDDGLHLSSSATSANGQNVGCRLLQSAEYPSCVRHRDNKGRWQCDSVLGFHGSPGSATSRIINHSSQCPLPKTSVNESIQIAAVNEQTMTNHAGGQLVRPDSLTDRPTPLLAPRFRPRKLEAAEKPREEVISGSKPLGRATQSITRGESCLGVGGMYNVDEYAGETRILPGPEVIPVIPFLWSTEVVASRRRQQTPKLKMRLKAA